MLSRIQSKKASSYAFFEVVKQNNRSGLIDLVLSTHCDPRYIRNEQEQTLLHVACELRCSGAIDMVRVLVEIYQCNPLITDRNSLTAYHYACLSGNLEVLSYLFRLSDHQFITNFQSLQIIDGHQSGIRSLISAVAQSGNTKILRFLFHYLEHGHRHDMLTLKCGLYNDQFVVVCKAVNCEREHSHNWLYYTSLFEMYCLDALKFFLDEYTFISDSHSDLLLKPGITDKEGYTSLLEIAYRLGNSEVAQYLTTSKGIGPVQIISNNNYYDRNDIHFTAGNNAVRFPLVTHVSPLHMAIRSGDIQTVKELFSQGHHLYSDTDTLLHSACVSGKKEIIEVLINKLDIDQCMNALSNGDTPLHVACEWGHLDICLQLLEQKECNINATNARGHTPLSLAVRHNRLKIFQTLLAKGANILVATNDTQETPLHFACCNVSSQFISSIFSKRNQACTPEFINAVDKYGDTALFNACRSKNIEIIRSLILHPGCNRSVINEITKEMPVHVACRMNSLDILKVLTNEGTDSPVQCDQINHLDQSLLHLACENDAEDIIDYLIDNKICEQNNFNYYGQSPLHIACKRGNTRIVKKLITSERFQITDKDKKENTILHYICSRDVVDPELIKLCLKSANSLITEQNLSKYNPLHYLCAGDRTQVLHCLLKHSLDHKLFNVALVAPGGDENDTPLHLAIKKRSSMIIKFIFNCSELSKSLPDAVCMQNFEKKNILHCVVDHRQTALYDANGREVSTFIAAIFDILLQAINSTIQEEDIVRLLYQKNYRQYTPLQYLICEDRYESTIISTILSRLLFSKLNPESKQRIFSVTTSDGNTLIHLAVKGEIFDAVKCLVDQQICPIAIYNERDESPLHMACLIRSRESDIGIWLCEHGYDPYQLDKSGSSPLFNAIKLHQSLPQKLFKTIYWKPKNPIVEVEVKSDSVSVYTEYYRQVMIDFKSLTHFQLPLPHCMLLHHRGDVRSEVIDIMIDCPNLQDSLGNTILHLCSVLIRNETNFLQILFAHEDCDVNLRNEDGNTPLHIACVAQNHSMVAMLLDSDKCNESLTSQNKYGQTPLFYAKDRDIINCLIINGANPNDVADSARVQQINEAFEKVRQEHPLDLTVTALVLGNSLAGKTTLIETLRRAYNWKPVDIKPSIGQSDSAHRENRTMGVDILEYKVLRDKPNDPRILFYDFAGHIQSFQKTHSILLQNLLSRSHLSPILFIIVVDVSDKIHRLSQVRYWTDFIIGCQPLITTGVIEVILIGSHIDEVRDKHADKQKSIKESLSRAIQPFECDTFKLIENPFLLDCRDSSASELLLVKGILLRSVKLLEEHTELDNRCHLVFSYLYEHFPDKPVTFQQLRQSFRKRKPTEFSTNESIIPLMANKLISLLENMQSRQHIFLIGHTESTANEKSNFWVLTAKAQKSIFNHVHGLLFANEEDFENYIDIESNVGVVSSTELKKAFPDLDYEMLQELLEYSELCKKINDKRVLQLIEHGIEESMDTSDHHQTVLASDSGCDDIDYFFFPGLVKETKKYILVQDKNYSYSSGWSLECIKGDFFKAIFLEVLLLRLTFQFATRSEVDKKLHRYCSIWNSGVAWSKAGVEMYVEMRNQNQNVIVIVQCLEGAELTAVELRSAVIQEVYNVKAKYAARTKTDEFVICNPKFNGDGLLVEPIHKVPMKNLALAIKNGSPYYVGDTLHHQHHINKDVLCFEPYTGVSHDLMTTLFDSSKANENVSEEIFRNIATLLKNAGARPEHIEHVMQLLRANESIDYHNLRDLFNKYSIFCGRNYKVS